MNILMAMPWNQRIGGVTHVAASLAWALNARGHRSEFLFPADDRWKVRPLTTLRGFPGIGCRLRDFPPEGASIRARLSWISTVTTALPQLVRYARAHHIDLVNVHYPTDGFALLVDLTDRLGIPLVVSAHGSDLLPDGGPASGAGLRRQLERADAIVAPSQGYLRSVVEAFPTLCGKIRCIYNGFDPTELGEIRHLQRASDPANVVVLCIAAQIHKKGIDVLLRAVRACTTDRLLLRVIGDGPLRPQLEAMAHALGISDRVCFLGQKSRDVVFEELSRCDMLVMPSRHASESFGLAALEAMAFGKPVVASAVGGLRELVNDGETGLLVPPEDPEALAKALAVLAADPELRGSMGEAGRSRAQQFTAHATADAYEALFTHLIAGGAPPVSGPA